MGGVLATCETFTIATYCLKQEIFSGVTIDRFEDGLNFFVAMAFGNPVGLVGLVGNTLCIIVFSKQYFIPTTTQHLFLVLSIVDWIHLVFIFLVVNPGVFCKTTCYMADVFRSHLYNGLTVVGMSSVELMRNWVIVLIGFERYLVTCRTMEFQTKWTVSRINIPLTAIIIVSLASRGPMIANFVLDSMPPHQCRMAFRMSTLSALMDAFGMSIFPLIALTFCTVSVLRSHRKQLKFTAAPSKMSKAGYRAHKAIMILLCCMNGLCVFYLFDGALSIIWDNVFYNQSICALHVVHKFFILLAVNGSILMSTMNCFVFVILWKKFRTELMESLRAIRRWIFPR